MSTFRGILILASLVLLAAIGYGLYRAGGAAEREATVKQAIDNIKKSEKDHDEIRRMDDSALCREYGFEWLPDEGRCG